MCFKQMRTLLLSCNYDFAHPRYCRTVDAILPIPKAFFWISTCAHSLQVLLASYCCISICSTEDRAPSTCNQPARRQQTHEVTSRIGCKL